MHSKDRFLCGLQIYIYLHKICLILFPKMSVMLILFYFFLEFLEHFIFCNVTCRVFNNIAHNLTVVFHGCVTHTYVVDKCVHKLIAI